MPGYANFNFNNPVLVGMTSCVTVRTTLENVVWGDSVVTTGQILVIIPKISINFSTLGECFGKKITKAWMDTHTTLPQD